MKKYTCFAMGMFAFCCIVFACYQAYTTPAIRYRGEIYIGTINSDSNRLYKSDAGSIYINEDTGDTRIHFSYKWYDDTMFAVRESESGVMVYDGKN